VDAGPLGQLTAVPSQGGFSANMPVTVAVRPEKVHIQWDRPAQADNILEGRVGPEAYFGDRSHYYVEVPGLNRPVAVAYQNQVRSLDNAESRGRQVWLTWQKDASVLLPR
jgi:ABC-type Fe3+/spermidine/putrescine transport system ATPase subunit